MLKLLPELSQVNKMPWTTSRGLISSEGLIINVLHQPRRLLMNPTFYGLEDSAFETINTFLSDKVDSVLEDLGRAQCIDIEEDKLAPRTLGKICSYYYLKHTTGRLFW